MITGILIYEDKERNFKFESNTLEILPDSIEGIKNRFNVYYRLENIKDKYNFINGITNDGKTIIFCNNYFKSINSYSVEIFLVEYYYEFSLGGECELNKHANIRIYGNDINYFYYYRNLIDLDFRGKPFFIQAKLENDNIKRQNLGEYKYYEKNVEADIEIYSSVDVEINGTKLEFISFIGIDIMLSDTQNIECILILIKNIFLHILDFLALIFRKRLVDINPSISIMFINGDNVYKGYLNYCDNSLIEKDSHTNFRNIIIYNRCIFENNVIGELLDLISKGEINLSHLPLLIKNRGDFISNDRMLKIFVAFEGQYSITYKGNKLFFEEKIKTEKGTKKRKLSLRQKMYKAFLDNIDNLKKYPGCIEIEKYSDDICKRLSKIRNTLAHNNLNFLVSEIENFYIKILEIVIYLMLFKKVGINSKFVGKIINNIFK